MKYGIRKIVAVICCLFIMVAVLSLNVFAVSEAEPNDNYVQATEINLDTDISGKSETYNPDYYKFTTTSDGYVEIELNHAYNAPEISASIYKYDGTNEQKLSGFEMKKESEYLKSFACGIEKGTYYIILSSYGEVDYTMKVLFTSTNDYEKELNDTVVTANPISANREIGGTISNVYDVDYYEFELLADDNVEMVFKHDYDKLEADIELNTYDRTTEEVLDRFQAGSKSETTNHTFALAKGTYFVKIKSYVNGGPKYSFILKSQNVKNVLPAGNSSDAAGTAVPSDSQQFTYGDFTYSIADSKVKIEKYTGSGGNVSIPEQINDMPVTAIAENAFQNTDVSIIKVPSSVVDIGVNAFGQDDLNSSILINCEDGSPAAAYAEEHNIRRYREMPTEETTEETTEEETTTEKKTEKEPEPENGMDKNKILIIAIIGLVVIVGVVAITIILLKKNNKNYNER